MQRKIYKNEKRGKIIPYSPRGNLAVLCKIIYGTKGREDEDLIQLEFIHVGHHYRAWPLDSSHVEFLKLTSDVPLTL